MPLALANFIDSQSVRRRISYVGHLHAGEAVMGEGERLSNETVGQSRGTE